MRRLRVSDVACADALLQHCSAARHRLAAHLIQTVSAGAVPRQAVAEPCIAMLPIRRRRVARGHGATIGCDGGVRSDTVTAVLRCFAVTADPPTERRRDMRQRLPNDGQPG